MPPAEPAPQPPARARRAWHHALPLALALLSLAIALAGDAAAELLRYERARLVAGEWWRLLSGHLVHLGWSHLVLNLAGLALIWGLFRQALATAAWWWIALASALAVSAGLYLFEPDLVWYVGLSGVLHGLFVAGLLAALQRERWWGDALLLAVVAAKLGWEQSYGALPGTGAMAGGDVIVDAHLYGAVGGVLAVLPRLLRRPVTPGPPTARR